MKNELGRKITSLTLMTIMFAGGLTFAAPGMEPAHAANEMLFVSAENAQFQNIFGGPQVIEVVVTNPDINRTDQSHGSPIVKVNGQDILMAQGTDGSWYAYIADKTQIDTADDAGTDGGFQFDTIFSQGDSVSTIGRALTETQGGYTNVVVFATALSNTTGGAGSFNDPVADLDTINTLGSTAWADGSSINIRGTLSR